MRVLIVEDVEEMLELLVKLVEPISGLKSVHTAKNTAEARLELDRRRPDVILLDEILPGESATDFAAEAAEHGIPVIFVTSSLASKSALPAGVASRLIKPSWNDLDQRRPELEAALLSVVDPTKKRR